MRRMKCERNRKVVKTLIACRLDMGEKSVSWEGGCGVLLVVLSCGEVVLVCHKEITQDACFVVRGHAYAFIILVVGCQAGRTG
jgi:hypothetical protein